MRNRGAALAALAVAVLGVACGGDEKSVVDQYFNAVKAKDNQTLSSFAAVTFDKPVEAWKITATSEEQKAPLTAPDLSAKVRELEGQISQNQKDARANVDAAQADEVRALRRAGKSVPASLQTAAAAFDKATQTDAELKKQLAHTKADLEKERRAMTKSVGQLDSVDGITGQVLSKTVDLDLTMKDEKPAPYVMTLRKYELQREGPRSVSRWVVADLKPRS
ncbi:MAG: hypothetical protein ABW221_15700 [Vicinamibacteria bacterium]